MRACGGEGNEEGGGEEDKILSLVRKLGLLEADEDQQKSLARKKKQKQKKKLSSSSTSRPTVADGVRSSSEARSSCQASN